VVLGFCAVLLDELCIPLARVGPHEVQAEIEIRDGLKGGRRMEKNSAIQQCQLCNFEIAALKKDIDETRT
jgi:hypothetical protein